METEKYNIIFDYCIYIGRFQPYHNGHAKVLEIAFKYGRKVLLFIGSAQDIKSIKNPFTVKERIEIIKNNLTEEELDRIIFIPIKDYTIDKDWLAEITTQVNLVTNNNTSIAITGYYEHANGTKFFEDNFSSYTYIEIKERYNNISATSVRAAYFTDNNVEKNWALNIPVGTAKYLREFKLLQLERYKLLTQVTS